MVNAVERFARSVGTDAEVVHGATVPVHDPVDEPDEDEVLVGDLVDEHGRPLTDDDDIDVPATRERGRLVQGMVRRPRRMLSINDLVDRDRARAGRRRKAKRAAVATGGALVRTGRGAGRVLAATGRGTGRWVWMPEIAELVATMGRAATVGDSGVVNTQAAGQALRARKDLGKTRWIRSGVLTGTAIGAWFGTPPLAGLVVEVMPWWGWGSAGVAAAAGCYVAGRLAHDVEPAEIEAAGMREPLRLSMSERAVTAALTEVLAELKIKGVVVKVRAAPWGWTVTAEITTVLTEKHLAAMALQFDTRRGGLLVAHVPDSERSRVIRLVMKDLLAVGKPAPAIVYDPAVDIHSPVRMAERFDGDPWMARLAGVHIALIGRIGSGKSTALLRIVDSLVHRGAVVGGIDLSDGADLRSWAPVLDPRLSALGDDAADAATALTTMVLLIKDRKARLAPGEEWRSSRADPPVRIVIDEYSLVALNPTLLTLVNYVVLYGRHADCMLVIADQRPTADMTGDAKLLSQVQVAIYCGMSLKDSLQLPKELRASGVAPGLLMPATPDAPNDAGKAFVTGVDPVPFMVRFGTYHNGEAARRAKALAIGPGPARLSAADELVIEKYLEQNAGVPDIILDTYDAIMHHSGDRNPERASSAEIADYLVKRKHKVTKDTVTKALRTAMGPAYPSSRPDDVNIDGRNPKGWYLRDVEAAITRYQELNPR